MDAASCAGAGSASDAAHTPPTQASAAATPQGLTRLFVGNIDQKATEKVRRRALHAQSLARLICASGCSRRFREKNVAESERGDAGRQDQRQEQQRVRGCSMRAALFE